MKVLKNVRKISILILIFSCFFIFSGFKKEDKKVFDYADLIDEEKETQLQSLAEQYCEKWEMDIAMVTVDDTEGKSTMKYCEDFFVEQEMGYENDDRPNKSGIVLCIDMQNRQVYITTAGIAIALIDDDAVDEITTVMQEYAADGEYYEVFTGALQETNRQIKAANKGELKKDVEEWKDFTGTYEEFYDEYLKNNGSIFIILKKPVVRLVIAVIIAGIVVLILISGNKSKMTVNGDTYMDRSRLRMKVKRDVFINKTTKKYKIETDSGGSSSGGSFHSGGGGNSFGGGGKSF